MLLLSLDEGSNLGLRGASDKDGNQAFSLFDLGNIFCNKDLESTYGKNTYYRLTKEGSEHKDEVESYTVNLRVSGSGQRETPCACIKGLQMYTMLLGGKVGADFRKIAADVFSRFMAGDRSLIKVINVHAASNSPLQQAFRAALPQDKSDPNDFFTRMNRTQSIHQVLLFVRYLTGKFRLTP